MGYVIVFVRGRRFFLSEMMDCGSQPVFMLLLSKQSPALVPGFAVRSVIPV